MNKHESHTPAARASQQRSYTLRLLRRQEVQEKTGLSSSAIYALIKKGRFPGSVPLGSNSVAWLESEIDDWIKQRIAVRNTTTKET